MLIGLIAFGYVGCQASGHARNTAEKKNAAVGTILDLCARGDDLARQLHERHACDTAEALNTGPADPAAIPTDEAQVNALIARYLQTHAITATGPTTDQVVAAARQVLADNPALAVQGPKGEQGIPGAAAPPPTDEQVNSAAAAYFSAHRAEFQGQPGTNGQPGTAGTNGVQGEPGTPGRGISSGPRFERTPGGDCEAVTVYTDGSEDRSPAGDAACPGGSTTGPPTDTTPPPTVTETVPAPPPPTAEQPSANTTPPTDDGLLGGLLGG